MRTRILFVASALGILLLAGLAIFRPINADVVSANTIIPAAPAGGKSLKRFGSDAELKAFFAEIAKKAAERGRASGGSMNTTAAAPSVDMAAAKSEAKSADKDSKADDSITNNQHAGVDEGGIVKLHGDHLVILRRGRLFTVAVGDQSLKPISSADAYGDKIDPNGTWYDEMLISRNTVAVIGYSYARGGTEIGLFSLDDAGKLAYRSTYHLRSNDYYSSRNYASRLVDGKLVFYTPYYLSMYGEATLDKLPAYRKWHKGATESEFQRMIPATEIYNGLRSTEFSPQLSLHTVTTCDIESAEMTCKANGVIGPAGSVFYVSGKNVFVWASDWYGSGKGSMLYKMPLTGESPAALSVTGSPVDQFSFLEDDEGELNVLVRANASGTGMWSSEVAAGDVALMTIGTDEFADGTEAVPNENYTALPKPVGYTFQNRFVGDYLLYGTGSGWWDNSGGKSATLYVVRRQSGRVTEVSLRHGVDRIEALGKNAMVIGAEGRDLDFSSIKLGSRPRIADVKIMKDASQGEMRSHGFFYKAEDNYTGLLGLPTASAGRAGYEHLSSGSAAISFFRNESLKLTEIGKLSSSKSRSNVNDNCKASCVDWYGNARPIFARGRIFALLGYELVEGELDEGNIYELRRVDFNPGRAKNIARLSE